MPEGKCCGVVGHEYHYLKSTSKEGTCDLLEFQIVSQCLQKDEMNLVRVC